MDLGQVEAKSSFISTATARASDSGSDDKTDAYGEHPPLGAHMPFPPSHSPGSSAVGSVSSSSNLSPRTLVQTDQAILTAEYPENVEGHRFFSSGTLHQLDQRDSSVDECSVQNLETAIDETTETILD